MAQSDSIANLAAALCGVQFEMQGAKRESLNPHYKSRYADLASVWDACRAALHTHGLAVVQAPEPSESGIRLRTVLLHTSGEWIDSVLTIPAPKQDPQGYGSAMSYARRYGLSAMIGVVADDDDDGAAASRSAPRQQPRGSAQTQHHADADGERDAALDDIRGIVAEIEKRKHNLRDEERAFVQTMESVSTPKLIKAAARFREILDDLPPA